MPPDSRMGRPPEVAASRLRHARCLLHPAREAAARCPHCGGTFCRECVTDEEGQLACPPCLRRLARPNAPTASPFRVVQQLMAGFAAFVCLVLLFFALLHWRRNSPEQHFLDSDNTPVVVNVDNRATGTSHE